MCRGLDGFGKVCPALLYLSAVMGGKKKDEGRRERTWANDSARMNLILSWRNGM